MNPILSFVRTRNATFLILGALVFQPAQGVSDHGLDLVLVTVSLAGLRMPVFPAVLWGMGAGFIQDLCSVSWVGPHLIANGLAAAFSSWARNRIYRERALTQGLVVTGACFLQQLSIWALATWGGSAPSFTDAAALASWTFLATSLFGFAASILLTRFGRRYRDPATA